MVLGASEIVVCLVFQLRLGVENIVLGQGGVLSDLDRRHLYLHRYSFIGEGDFELPVSET